MSETNVLNSLLEETVLLLAPLQGASSSEDSLKRFFRYMGWNFGDNSGMPIANITATVSQIVLLIEPVIEIIDEGEIESLDQVLPILNGLKSLFERIDSLVDSFDGAELSSDQIVEIIEDITHFLLVRYLANRQYLLVEILRWIEVVQIKEGTETQFNSSGQIIRYPYVFEIIDFDNLSRFISDPAKTITEIYFSPFDRHTVVGAKAFTDKLFPRIGKIAQILGGTYVYGIKPAYGVDFGSVGNEMASGALTIKWRTPLDELNFGATLAYSPQERGNLGWIIVPYGEITLNSTLGEYFFKIESALQVGGIIIGDDGQISFESAGGLTKVGVQLYALKLADTELGVSYLIGEKEGSRLELGKVSVGSSLEVTTSNLDFDVHFNIDDAKIVISGGGRDGFMANILPEEGIEVPFDFLLGYSSQKSLYFGINAGLELALPVHIDLLGILKIDEIYLKIKTQDYGLKVESSLSGGVSLGPLDVSFQEIGLQSKLDWTNTEKNIGFANLSMDFKPPNGLGLSIDASVIKGGGYLFFDFDREEYAGALELVISEWIALKAIGLVTTKMPDGSKGFSLIIIISLEFGTGIQLGFGFTLIGVGGLLGLNRTVKIQPLAEGVRTGAIDRIMFPQDIVANAPRIISDLRSFFPAKNDQFLIGPMAKIGYGTPTLISLSLGVIIEFPTVSITILGVLKVVLPDEEAEVLKLQVNFIGRIEPSNSLLWFYAELFDSKILFMTIEGGMGLLVNWGDQANFVISVGGFHPRYTPPPLPFPEPPRLAITLLNESYAKVRIEAYFAVTSNTVQFGARVELFFGVEAFNIEGFFGFDALFQFDPFYFIFELSLSLAVKLFGMGMFSVSFNGLLEGPTPWHIKGKGSIGFLFFSVAIPFEETWGEEPQTELPLIKILPLIEQEFEAISNWEAIVPPSSNILVTLKKLGETPTEAPETDEGEETDNTTLVLHPVGTLRISQRKIPLNLVLDKLGNQRPSDVNKLSVTAKIKDGDELVTSYVQEKFAPGEFIDLDELSKFDTAFVKFDSGIVVEPKGEQLKTSMAVKRVIRYETILIDNNFKRYPIPFFDEIQLAFSGLYASLFGHFLKGSAVTKSPLSQNNRIKLQPNQAVIQVLPNLYSVAFNDTNKPIASDAMAFSSQAMASDYMHDEIRKKPNIAAQMHVIPNTEINIAV